MKNKFKFCDLLQPDFKHTGKPFNDTKELFKYYNIYDVPDYFTNEQLETLYKNGLVKYSIEQTVKAMQENI